VNDPRLVCLIGAESTGKTTLAQELAQRCDGLWVPEYLRTFCDEKCRTPLQVEQLPILHTQVAQEHLALQEAKRLDKRFVFCDTAPLLTAIYSDFVFSDNSLYPLARSLHARYAFTLLLQPDIHWVADGRQRDGAHVRPVIHAMIERELGSLSLPVFPVEGQGAARFSAAQSVIHSF
jgi:nicotinamide riboside kinase